MGIWQRLMGQEEPARREPPPPSYLPGMRYDLWPNDPDRLPSEIVLTRRDGAEVVYVPKTQSGGATLPKDWRAFGEPWVERSAD